MPTTAGRIDAALAAITTSGETKTMETNIITVKTKANKHTMTVWDPQPA